MGEVIPFVRQSGFLVSINNVADVLGVGRERIRRVIVKNGVQPHEEPEDQYPKYELAALASAVKMRDRDLFESIWRLEQSRVAHHLLAVLDVMSADPKTPAAALKEVAYAAGATAEWLPPRGSELPAEWLARISAAAKDSAQAFIEAFGGKNTDPPRRKAKKKSSKSRKPHERSVRAMQHVGESALAPDEPTARGRMAAAAGNSSQGEVPA